MKKLLSVMLLVVLLCEALPIEALADGGKVLTKCDKSPRRIPLRPFGNDNITNRISNRQTSFTLLRQFRRLHPRSDKNHALAALRHVEILGIKNTIFKLISETFRKVLLEICETLVFQEPWHILNQYAPRLEYFNKSFNLEDQLIPWIIRNRTVMCTNG